MITRSAVERTTTKEILIMTSTTLTARATRTSLLPMRIGLVLGAVLSALQIITGSAYGGPKASASALPS